MAAAAALWVWALGCGANRPAHDRGATPVTLVMPDSRPRRTLVAARLGVPAFSVFLFALAVHLAVQWVGAAALLVGGCLEVFSVNWATTMMQEISPGRLSRLAAYDLLGSFALAPVGTAVAGPVAGAFGTSLELTAGGIPIVLLTLSVTCEPEERLLRRLEHAPTAKSTVRGRTGV